jgi:hypothetical protein
VMSFRRPIRRSVWPCRWAPRSVCPGMAMPMPLVRIRPFPWERDPFPRRIFLTSALQIERWHLTKCRRGSEPRSCPRKRGRHGKRIRGYPDVRRNWPALRIFGSEGLPAAIATAYCDAKILGE